MSQIEVNKDTCSREAVIQVIRGVLERDNSLSRCCAVRALEKLKASDEESRKRLIAALEDPDPDVRMDAAMVLGRLRVEEAIEPLIVNLKHDPEGEVRVQATEALSRIKGDKAVDVLIECLREPEEFEVEEFGDDMEFAADWEIQGRAVASLGEIGDARAVESVIELLENEDYEDLHDAGFRTLAKLSDIKAREFLLKVLKNGSRLTRRRAAKAMIELRGSSNGSALDPAVVNGLTGALIDDDPDVRIYAARALAEIGGTDPRVIVPITMLLSDKDKEVCREVAAVLGKMQGKEVVDRVLELLKDPSKKVRARAVQVLGDIGDTKATEDLMGLLDTEDVDLRYEVVKALGKIGAAEPAERITAVLNDNDADANVRTQAAWALGRIVKHDIKPEEEEKEEDKEIEPAEPEDESQEDGEVEKEVLDPMEVLINSAHDDNERISFTSLTSLVQIDEKKAVGILIEILIGKKAPEEPEPEAAETEERGDACEEEQAQAEQIVGEILSSEKSLGKEEASTLASIMASQTRKEAPSEAAAAEAVEPVSGHQRLIAARLLGGIKDPGPEAVDVLIDAAGSSDLKLRREALVSLGTIGDARALPVILNGLDSENREVRLAALDSFQGFSEVHDIKDRCIELLKDPDAYVRQRSVEILGSLGDPGIIESVARCLEDEDRSVRRETLRVLAELGDESLASRISPLIFDGAGDLRMEASAALRRLKCFGAADILLKTLDDMGQEEYHWVCIDALGELFAPQSTAV